MDKLPTGPKPSPKYKFSDTINQAVARPSHHGFRDGKMLEYLLQASSSTTSPDNRSPVDSPKATGHSRQASLIPGTPRTPEVVYSEVFQFRPESDSKIEIEHRGSKMFLKTQGMELRDLEMKPAPGGWVFSARMVNESRANTPAVSPNMKPRTMRQNSVSASPKRADHAKPWK